MAWGNAEQYEDGRSEEEADVTWGTPEVRAGIAAFEEAS